MLESNKKLQNLFINYTRPVDYEDMKFLAEGLKYTRELKSLKLRTTNKNLYTLASLEEFTDVFEKLYELNELELVTSGNILGMFKKWLKVMPVLQRLKVHISDCKVEEQVYVDIFKGLQNLKELKELDLNWQRSDLQLRYMNDFGTSISSLPKLEKLSIDFSQNTIGNDVVKIIDTALSEPSPIKYLKFYLLKTLMENDLSQPRLDHIAVVDYKASHRSDDVQ